MSVAGIPSRRHPRSYFRSARHRRRATPLSRFSPQVLPLEERCLLASSLLGTESLMNTTVADNQRFAASGDRTMDVTGAGTVITVWATTDAKGSRIVAQRTGADGGPLGAEFAVSEVSRGQRSNAVVAAAQDGRFVVTWVSRGNPQDPSGTGVFARSFSPDGTPLSGEFRVNATVRGNQQAPSIDWVSADRFVIAWDGAGKGQARSIDARVFDVSGRAVTGAVRVPGTHRGAQRDAAVVSLPDGGFQVAWAGAGKGDVNGIFSRQFNSAGKPLGPEFRVNTSRTAIESQPTIARDGDRQVVIAWQSRGNALDPNHFGVVARRFAPGGKPLGGEFLLNQTQRGSQSDPSIAFLADGRFVAVWEGAGPADSNGVYLREFFGNGTARGGEELVNTTVAGRQADPTVHPMRRGYVVAWGGRVDGGLGVESRAEDTRGGDTNGIAIQRFGDALIAMPGNTPGLTSPSDVLWYDASATDPKYMKTITITNNSPDQTIYPFLEDANSRSPLPGDPAPSPTYAGTGVFDPFDPIIHEYRGYIGYRSADGQDYLGLLPGQTITVNVPLAFWDAGRLIISTDAVVSPGGSDLLGPDPNASPADQAAQPNPFYFHYVDSQEILIGSTTAGSATLSFTPIYDQNILGPNGKPAVNPNRPLRPTSVVPGMLVTGPGIASGNPILSVTSATVQLMYPVGAVDPNDPTKQENTDYTFQLPNGVAGGNSALVTPDGTHLQPNQIQLNHALDPEKALLYYLAYGVTQGQTYAITSSGRDLQAGTVVTGADVATGVVTLSKETVSEGRGPNIYTVVIPPIGATRRFTVDSVSGAAYPGSITNGRIMWYHSLAAQGPQKDAPGQLTEITFRSDYYAPENNAGFQYLIGTDADTLNANDFNLINYDVSYVDSMVLPVAMQADDVPIEPPVGGGTPKFPFGWAGSSQTIEDTETAIQGMQTAIKNFASSDPSVNGLGTYFADQAHPGGQGYPNYYNPNATVDTKIPSGQNLFLSSPFNDVRSVYNNDRYALTSGGAGVVMIPGGAQGTSDGTDILMLTPDPKLEGLGVGMVVTLGPGQPDGPVVPPDTRITPSPQYPDGLVRSNGQIVGVHLSNAIPKATTTQATYVYNIATPQADYAATAIMSLWYTWANYYVAYAMNDRHATGQMLSGIIDSTTTATNVLTLTDAVPASLVEGTAVSGAGIPDGNCIILKINGNQLILSELVKGSGVPISYKFTPPALTALAGYSDSQGPAPVWKLLQPFTPSGQTAIDFSKAVYEVMKTMSTTVPSGGKYPSVQLFANIIGATVSKLKSLPNVNSSPAGVDIQTRVTNAIKSVLRGVPDYTNALYSNQSLWYPDPSLAVEGSGQSFNIYNLDPFVWFVHEKMGLSGYGFSVDDDTADVGANYTNHLNVSVGGLGGLSTPAGWSTAPPWTTAAPYGPVFGTPTVPPVNGSTTIAGLSPTLVKQVMAYNKPQNLLGSLVNGPGVPLGTTIANLDPAGGSVVLTDALHRPTAPFDYTFFAPVTVRGAVGTPNQASTTIINLDGPAYETLQHLGPLSNIQVSGPGIGEGSPVTVAGLSVVKGVRTVTLSRPLLFPKRFKPGNYGYTFGYGRPYTPPGA